jgi:hypothetical protein
MKAEYSQQPTANIAVIAKTHRQLSENLAIQVLLWERWTRLIILMNPALFGGNPRQPGDTVRLATHSLRTLDSRIQKGLILIFKSYSFQAVSGVKAVPSEKVLRNQYLL